MFSAHIYNTQVILMDSSLQEETFIVFPNNGVQSALPKTSTRVCFQTPLACNLFSFHPLSFMLGLPWPTRWVSYRQRTIESCKSKCHTYARVHLLCLMPFRLTDWTSYNTCWLRKVFIPHLVLAGYSNVVGYFLSGHEVGYSICSCFWISKRNLLLLVFAFHISLTLGGCSFQ